MDSEKNIQAGQIPPAEIKSNKESDESSYRFLTDKVKAMADRYGGLFDGSFVNSFGFANRSNLRNPWIQNDRMKSVSSLPVNYSKDKVAEMIVSPYANEQPIRQVAHALEHTAYPYFKIRETYQSLLSYFYTISPLDYDEDDVEKTQDGVTIQSKASKDMMREWRLVSRYARELDVKRFANKLVGQTLQEGKVFYTVRHSIDKAHNKINYVFPQQLPSDQCKIVGENNVSGKTIAFNMFYFLKPGADWRQYGDLFLPYVQDLNSILDMEPNPKFIYGRKASKRSDGKSLYVNVEKFNGTKATLSGRPELYEQNGMWYYWAILPIDRVWTFEIDDCSPAVITPLTGLFLSMVQIAQYEALQYELLVNPLVSVLTAEIPYYDNVSPNAADPIKLSPDGRTLFESYFYAMMQKNNTAGIGIYSAPFQNMKMHQLAEAPNAEKIGMAGYAQAILKSGLAGILPVTTEPRAGLAMLSAELEANFARVIYWQMNRMMNCLMRMMRLRWEWRFNMFGTMTSREEDRKSAKEGMTLGILMDTLRYAAMNDYDIVEDMSVSRALIGSGILDLRVPLVSSYTAKQSESNLPPQGGRPKSEGITSDGQEQDFDDDMGK